MEFVCTLWNILTIPQGECGSIAYLIKDPSARSKISYTDVKAIMELMLKRKVDKDPALAAIFSKLRKDFPPDITLQEFVRFAAANPSIMHPLEMLQLHLRRKIIGEGFWNKLMADRRCSEEQSKMDYVKKLQANVLVHNEAFRRRELAEDAENKRLSRVGKGTKGDQRENMIRKESRLLSFFGMKKQQSRNTRSKKVVPSGVAGHDLRDIQGGDEGTEMLTSGSVKKKVGAPLASPGQSSKKRTTAIHTHSTKDDAQATLDEAKTEYNPNMVMQVPRKTVVKPAPAPVVDEEDPHERKKKHFENRRRRSVVRPTLVVS